MNLLGALMRGMVARADGFMSTLTGLGDAWRDKTRSFSPYVEPQLDAETCRQLFKGGDLGKKIAKGLPEKALKQGFGLASSTGDMDPEELEAQTKEVLAEADRVGLRDKALQADVWGRVYGFGAIVLGASGAGLPNEPMDDERVQRLDWMWVVDRREMIPEQYYGDPESEKFGEVELYRIQPFSSFSGAAGTTSARAAMANMGAIIHETRVVTFPGLMTSRADRIENGGCDDSVYQDIVKVLQQAENNWDSMCQLMADMSQGVFWIDGLINLLAAGNEQSLLTRMQSLDRGRSTSRAIVLDAERERFERVVTPMGGVDEVMLRTWQRLAAAAEMPLTVLFGVSPAGLNATGESDIRLWYDNVQAHRTHVLGPRLVRILRLLSKTLGHNAPDTWEVAWPSLWQMSPAEAADVRLKTTQADDIEIKNGTVLPEEVGLTRYCNGEEYNAGKLQIDANTRKQALKQALADIVNPPPAPPAPGLPPGGGKSLPPNGGPPAPGAQNGQPAAEAA